MHLDRPKLFAIYIGVCYTCRGDRAKWDTGEVWDRPLIAKCGQTIIYNITSLYEPRPKLAIACFQPDSSVCLRSRHKLRFDTFEGFFHTSLPFQQKPSMQLIIPYMFM